MTENLKLINKYRDLPKIEMTFPRVASDLLILAPSSLRWRLPPEPAFSLPARSTR